MDASMALKQASAALQGLDSEGRIKWAEEWRELGNRCYAREKYAEATDIYLQCLVALEDMSDLSAKERITLPVLCNLSSCALLRGQYTQAEELCSKALELDPHILKVSRLFIYILPTSLVCRDGV